MCVNIYLYMYVCMYVCMYVYIYILYARKYSIICEHHTKNQYSHPYIKCMYFDVYVKQCINIYIYVYNNLCVCACDWM